MNCYKCGYPFTTEEYCPGCRADLKVYRIAGHASNAYYNKGLRKAQVRDLTGAREALAVSLSLNKKNIDARNLLGLVLLEMGDTVEALSQWVISRDIQKEKNAAVRYIKEIQGNQNKFEAITRSVQKYNKALEYAKSGNTDMACIQLRKVVQVNPKLVKAQLLLALLYIEQKEYSKARKCLKAVLAVDKNNTTALQYIREIHLSETATQNNAVEDNFLPKKHTKEIIENVPPTGNDVIIPASTYKEPSNGAITIINILLGVVIGAALIWFLIIPARYRGITEEYNNSIAQYSEKLSSSNVELNELERQVNAVTKERDELLTQLDALSGEDGANKMLTMLINSANYYFEGDTVSAAEAIKSFSADDLSSDSAKKLYNTLSSATFVTASHQLYNRGIDAYNTGNMESAAQLLVRAYDLNADFVEAAFYAGRAYQYANDAENALKYFKIVVDNFPNTGYFADASAYVATH